MQKDIQKLNQAINNVTKEVSKPIDILNYQLKEHMSIIKSTMNKSIKALNNEKEQILKRWEELFQVLNEPIEINKAICEAINEEIIKLLSYYSCDMPDIQEALMLFYLINYDGLCKDCISIDDVINVLNIYLNQTDTGLDIFEMKSGGNKGNKIRYCDIVGIAKQYYLDDCYLVYSYQELIELIQEINEYTDENFNCELQLLKETPNEQSQILILLNTIENIVYKIIKHDWKKVNAQKDDKININLTTKAIIDTLVLKSDFNDRDEKQLSELIIPNRNIMIHKSITAYVNYKDTLLVLVNMAYNIIKYHYLKWIKSEVI